MLPKVKDRVFSETILSKNLANDNSAFKEKKNV